MITAIWIFILWRSGLNPDVWTLGTLLGTTEMLCWTFVLDSLLGDK